MQKKRLYAEKKWSKKLLLEEKRQRYLITKKHKKVCATHNINHNDQLLVSVSAVNTCASILLFALLV